MVDSMAVTRIPYPSRPGKWRAGLQPCSQRLRLKPQPTSLRSYANTPRAEGELTSRLENGSGPFARAPAGNAGE